jgi:hypothetical protein
MMVTVSLDSPSCEVTLFDPISVVYWDATRQTKGLYRLKYVGALWSGLAYLSRYNSGWFWHSTGATRRNPTSPGWTTSSSAPRPKPGGPEWPRLCTAVNPQRAKAPRRRKKPRRRRVEATPPDHPWSWPILCLRSRRVAGLRASERRKKSSPPRMNMLSCCHTPILLHANISHLQSSSFSTPARVPRNGNRANGLCGGDHCHGGHHAIGW